MFFERLNFQDHRRILTEELTQIAQNNTTTNVVPILSSQLVVGKIKQMIFLLNIIFCLVFLETGLPYIGFGFVDNFVMIVAVDS